MRVVIKIASEVEQSISHVGWGVGGNHHCEKFWGWFTGTSLLNSSGIAGIYHARSGELRSVQKPNSGFAHVS